MTEPVASPALPRRRRIYLMRHGSVNYYDASGRPLNPESVPLNDHGRMQAKAAGQTFAQAEIHFDRVIVSGLPRTVETAELVLAQTGQQMELDICPQLAELRSGSIKDIADENLREAFLGVFEGVVPQERRFMGGESIGELMDRVHPEISRIRADLQWDTVLMVLHGGVNRAVLSLALTGQRIYLGNFQQAAGCINILDVGNAPHDWLVRMTNFSPPDLLQGNWRHATMEAQLAEYLRLRNAALP